MKRRRSEAVSRHKKYYYRSGRSGRAVQKWRRRDYDGESPSALLALVPDPTLSGFGAGLEHFCENEVKSSGPSDVADHIHSLDARFIAQDEH